MLKSESEHIAGAKLSAAQAGNVALSTLDLAILSGPVPQMPAVDLIADHSAIGIVHDQLAAAALALARPLAPQRSEIVFIESDVGNFRQLVDGIGPGKEVHVLNASEDGLQQIAAVLQGRDNIDALHIISHGRDGGLDLGALALTDASLGANAGQLRTIGGALAKGADILLYGCNVGAGAAGQSFIDHLALVTGADIAASDNATGAAKLGGDWQLEIQTGKIDTPSLVDAKLAALYGDVLNIASATVSFSDSSGNFTNNGSASSAAGDVIYKVNGIANYLLKIDGATRGVYHYTNYNYITIDTQAKDETKVTASFGGGQMFTANSIKVSNYDANFASQTVIFQGYDAGGTKVGSAKSVVLGKGSNTPTFDLADFSSSGFTNISSLTMVAAGGSNGGLLHRLLLDDFSLSSIQPALAPPPSVSSATYNASTNVLAVTGANMTKGDTISPAKLALTGEGGNTYTLTSVNVMATSATAFSVTLNAADQLAVEGLLNKVGTTSSGATTFNLAAASGWDATAASAPADASNAVTVSSVSAPSISAASYDAASGVLTVTASGLVGVAGAADISVGQLTLKGQGGATYTLTSSNVEAGSPTSFSVTLNAADQLAVNGLLNQNGAVAVDGTTFNVAAGTGWNTALAAADLTSNGVTVMNVSSPAITSATYDGASGTLVVTGSHLVGQVGAANDVALDKLTFTGLGNNSYTLTTAAVDVSSASGFTATLNGADRTALAALFDKAGGAASDTVSYNLAAADDWNSAIANADTADALNAVTVSIPAPSVSHVIQSSGNDYYKAGSTVSIEVHFDRAVTVNTGGGIPTLQLETGATDQFASYASGSGSQTLTFNYTVQAGDASADLQYLSTAALVLNGATIKAGNDATLTLPATNGGQSLAELSAVVIDTVAPAAATLAMDSASDTGVSSSDQLTANSTPVFSGTAEANATVTLYDTDGSSALGSTTADAGGSWSITSSALSEGPHTVSVKVSDAAGNVGVASAGVALTVDLTASTTTIATFGFSADTGGSPVDFITRTAAQTISGTTSANLVPGEAVQVSLDNGASWATATTNTGASTWSLAGQTLAASNTLKVRVVDDAGNASTPVAQAYVLDQSAPAAPSATLASASDTGSSRSDGITKVTTPTISGTAEANAAITVYDTDGSTVLGSASANGSGDWSLTSAALSEGQHTLTAKATDLGGNVSAASSELIVTIDTTVAVANTPDLNSGSDSGGSNTDNYTSLRTPVFTGTAESYSTVVLYDSDGSSALGTATANGSGKWSITSSSLSDGVHTVSTKVSDLAGNTSAASTALAVTIDTAAPAAPSAPTLAGGSDSGVSASDGITNVSTPTFTGTTEANAIINLFDTNGKSILGTTTADGSGVWSLTVTQDIVQAGSHTVRAVATDLAGNVSARSTTSVIKIDTTAPALFSAIKISDTALKIGDTASVTFAFTEAVTGFTTADLSVSNGKASGLSSSDGGITWTATLTPMAAVAATINMLTLDNTGYTDLAGNAGVGTSNSVNYGVDTVQPSLAAAITVSDTSLKIGDTATVTFVFTEAVTGLTTADVGAPNGVLSNLTTGDGGITWTATLTPNASAQNAVNSLTLDLTGVTDLNGNAGAGSAASPNYLVDTLRPALASPITFSDANLADGQAASVTFTFAEAVSGLTTAAIDVPHGALSKLSSADGGTTWTATLTPTAHTTAASNVLTLDYTALSDAVGNVGSGTAVSSNYALDAVAPTATVTLDSSMLLAGKSAVATLTFSEAVTGLSLAGLSAGGATVTNLHDSGGGLVWTATVTPAADSNASGQLLTLAAGAATDLAGNANVGAAAPAYAVDTTRPGAQIVVANTSMAVGQTSAVTITFSEPVAHFDLADLSVAGGALSALASADGGRTWTATLTPTGGVSANTNHVVLDNSGVDDLNGNAGAGTSVSNNYAVGVPAPDSGPAPVTVDGVPTTSSSAVDTSTGLVNDYITVPTITGARADDPASPNATLADIPLGITGAGQTPGTTLTVSLPSGASLQADGPVALLSNGGALIDLIGRIHRNTSDGSAAQNALSGHGADFLASLPGGVLLQTRTLMPAVAPDHNTGAAIQINGSSTSVAPGGAANGTAIALVIDATHLPANTQLVLNNVDFAAIVGAATLRGGDGPNFVVGDDAAQNILLGADNDKLFGGGGDDIVGSAGGDDYLDGGAGNDIVAGGIGNDTLLGGAGNDELTGGRSDRGQWTFVLDGQGQLSARHDMAVFAPGQTETLGRAELAAGQPALAFANVGAARLTDLAMLYDAAFNRAPDLDGINFWSAAPVSVDAVGIAFLQSKEWLGGGGATLSDTEFLDRVYQQALNRAPDASGLAFWSGVLATSPLEALHARAQVLTGIALSVEHRGTLSAAGGVVVAGTKLAHEQGWIVGSGDDVLDGGAGNDVIVGGDGVDTVVYGAALSSYKVLLTAGGQLQVLDRANGELDVLSGIERGQFGGVAVDLAVAARPLADLTELAGLYRAVLGRAPDLAGLDWWSKTGVHDAALASGFVGSSEFRDHTAAMDDAAFVNLLYQNTGLQKGDAGGEAAWVSYLGQHGRAELVAAWVDNPAVAASLFGTNGLWLF